MTGDHRRVIRRISQSTSTHQPGDSVDDAPAVLVVDDEQSLAEVLASVLRREGWIAYTAYTGSSAVQAARDIRPEVIDSSPTKSGPTRPNPTTPPDYRRWSRRPIVSDIAAAVTPLHPQQQRQRCWPPHTTALCKIRASPNSYSPGGGAKMPKYLRFGSFEKVMKKIQ